MSGQAAIIAFSANPGFTVQHTVNGQMKLSGNYWAKAQPNSSPLAYDLFQADAKFQPVGNTIAAVFLKVDNGRVFVS